MSVRLAVRVDLTNTLIRDRLNSKEASLLTAALLTYPKHVDIPCQLLPGSFSQSLPAAPRPFPAESVPGTKPENATGSWAFQRTMRGLT